ncbi:MAG: MBL fold metallo-hydrolase [Actinomycetota bacterium]|nr:MBL fold metallo-hydrolase [Actinomycetota bacterium]
MSPSSRREEDSSYAVRISWLGHAMFIVEDNSGHRLVTDPYDDHVGYPLPDIEADIVLVSHDHLDHSNVAIVKGDPTVVRNPESMQIEDIAIEGFPTYHDASEGSERGDNIVFRWRMEGLTFVHLGDIGHLMEKSLAEELSGIDVLFVPVGGTFTIDDAQAAETVEALKPRIAIPMHFKNDACGFPIKTVQPFLSRFSSAAKLGKPSVRVSGQDLPEPTRVLVLDYMS